MHTCIAPHEAAVTCTKYDLTYELLWIGYIDGRVSSFSVDQHSDMRVYSSFKLTSSVIDIVPTVTGIVVVCANSVSIHTVGGLQQCSYKVDEVYDSKPLTASGAAAIEAAETRNVTFRCACGLDSALVGNVYTLNSMNRSRLLIGCSTSCVLVIEADFGNMTIRPIAQYDVAGLPPMSISTEISAGAAPSDDALSTPSTVTPAVLTHLSVSITCVLNNFTTCVVAASNGKVYVLDGKLLLKIVANTNLHTMRARSKPKTGTSAGRAVAVAVQYAPVLFGQGVITSSLQCYDKGGYITHLALDKSDNKTLFYCGLVSTGSGAGWKGVNEGYKYTADPLVHILDIRNNLRQMLPMTMPLASPTLIACGMIGMDRGDGVMAYTSSRLLSAAATGAVQLARVFNSTPDPMTASSIYVPLTMRLTNSYSEPKGVHATAIAVAGSGQYFVLGCNNGSVFQYYLPPTAYDESMAHPPLTVIRCDEGVETSRCEHPVTHTTMHHNAASLTNWPLDNFTYDNSDIELKNPYSTAILGSVASYTLPHVRSPADYTLAMSSRAYSQGESVMRREQLEEECIMTGREMAPHEADLLEFPLSSFLSTPHVALQTFKATHLVRREINMEILRATQQRDFIGYGHNPGYAIRNSLLQMQQLATQRGMKTSRAPHKPSATAGKDGMVGPFLPYQILDPRFTPLEVSAVRLFIFAMQYAVPVVPCDHDCVCL